MMLSRNIHLKITSENGNWSHKSIVTRERQGVKGNTGKMSEEHPHLKSMLSKRSPQRLRVTKKAMYDGG